MSDKSAVEKLADEFAKREAAARYDTSYYYEGQRDAWDLAESDLRAAIEADRAAGWFGPPEAWRSYLSIEWERIAKGARAEVERLRAERDEES